MLEKFFPDVIVDKVQDINLDDLRKKGIKGLVLDIDNTLVAQFTMNASEDIKEWIQRVKDMGFLPCIISNASKKRVAAFNTGLDIPAIHRAYKPSPNSYLRAATLLGIKCSEIAAVGDQIFTDIYGGNRINMYTILVKPIDKKEILFVKLKRHVERFVLFRHSKAAYNKNSKLKRTRWKEKSAVRHSSSNSSKGGNS
ncbi:YqeG family HAD IIIA-type phosphatase [Pseudobacteroides cellulosolvens]|uniref:HAD superfamily (Subfamily IIIA) phosphatase, TIGR01668 n=1 Tax=Pseudobacteroides cellulosolvens ATCC 35603 = DSM 2933 TaxID=398512 RepID=A0A0L6JMW6_9FIRM|nr:YqeG family HAD IIIA-type phosphatase [Pseudobacteroides cellulosolvens]KNY26717.1 HAD superfamily (subfamily IIIA) phosphatase, TIGR01668 [Pseudobacteroides cellulosolvens ATCC 35603 = DSM 2933]